MNKRPGLDNAYIAELYKSMLSTIDIAAEMGVAPITISRRLKKMNIPLRSYSESREPLIGWENAMGTYRNREWLLHQYCELKGTQDSVGKLCGVSPTSIHKWLKRFGIEARPKRESNYCDISDDLNQYLDGLLLGDGCVSTVRDTSAYYEHGEKHEKYIIYLSGKLKKLGLNNSGNVYSRKGGFEGYEENTYFSFKTSSYVDLLDVRKRWYPYGIKIVPRDLYLTQVSALNWYIGDGHLAHPKRRKDYIVLCTNGFTEDDNLFLLDLLADIGVIGTLRPSDNTIRLSNENAFKFLDFIGDCPDKIKECYQYKWRIKRKSNAAL